MSNLISQMFQGHSIRFITLTDGEVWFVGKDITLALGYSELSKSGTNAITKFCINPRSYKSLAGHRSGDQANDEVYDILPHTLLLNRDDVSELCARCGKPEAIPFRTWVFREVLPSIFNTGSYSINQNISDENLLKFFDDPKQVLKLLGYYAERTLIAEAKVQQLEATIEENAPNLEVYQVMISQKGLLDVGVFGNITGIGRTNTFKYLKYIGWIQKTSSEDTITYPSGKIFQPSGYKPYQSIVNNGWLKLKLVPNKNSNSPIYCQVFLTPKGADLLYKKLLSEPKLKNKKDFIRNATFSYIDEDKIPSNEIYNLKLNHMDLQSDSIN